MVDPTLTPSRLFLAAVGEQILTYRETAGLSIEQLAEVVGVSADDMDAIEHGWLDPRLGLIVKIGDALNTTVAELLDVDGSELWLPGHLPCN